MPQVPIPEEIVQAEHFAPPVALDLSYPYPSGHMLRSVIIFAALYPLSENRSLHTGVVLVLLMMAAAHVNLGVHWGSDVVGEGSSPCCVRSGRRI